MADEQGSTPQAGAATPPAPAAGSGTTPDPGGVVTGAQPQAGSTTQTAEELQAVLERERKDRQEANKEAEGLRKRLKALEAAEDERKKAAMTEQEKIAAELADLKAKQAAWDADRKALVTKQAVLTEATSLNFHSPDVAYKLLDSTAIEYADDGTPTNLKPLLTALATSQPYLVRSSTSTAPGVPGRGSEPKAQTLEEFRAREYGTRGAADFFGGGVREGKSSRE